MNNATHIAIHKHGEEGGLHIDATNGRITTVNEERPLWAEGYVKADMEDYKHWVTSRLGAGAPETLTSPQILEAGLLAWEGVDEEGDLVEITANDDTRTSLLATVLGIDTSADNFDNLMEGAVAEAMVNHDMTVNPTTEASLAEAEGQSFSDDQQKVQNG